MASVKSGQQTRPPEWWRHLRAEKRTFWKSERKVAKQDAAARVEW